MFLNREEAGLRLSLILVKKKVPQDSVLVSIPRGGVVVGKVISDALSLPLDCLIVKKIGAPENKELAIGATGSDGIVYWDEELFKHLKISEETRIALLEEAIKTIRKQEINLGLKTPKVKDKTVIIVDDGVATGATSIAASLIAKSLGARKIILATPVISSGTREELEKYFDEIVSVEEPQSFQAVGQFYKEFPQVEDNEVRKILDKKRQFNV